MHFNLDKCKVLSIAKNVFEQILPFQLYFYKLGDRYLDYADSEKDLGVIINRNFSNDKQCDKIYSIMNQKLGMLKRVCYFTKCQKQKRSLFIAIVRIQLNHCCIVWRPSDDTKLARFESIQKRAVKWILNEEYQHYSDLEYITRLKDLQLLPIKYFFVLNDLVRFQKVYNNNYCIKLPSYYRPYDDNDRAQLRCTIVAPDFYNSQKEKIDLNLMRAVSHDSKSLKCTLSHISPILKKSFFFRSHILWNHLPLNIRDEISSSKFLDILIPHLWDIAMRPD